MSMCKYSAFKGVRNSNC